ncbi:AfsA-related hotdog domain-containing protein [Streptomyces virginiae]|uniref:AfsA-related hotdog domain-containing protein n=1 Tax=Streptomyces virginiae TaxID=1961 RepID=UPI003723C0BF
MTVALAHGTTSPPARRGQAATGTVHLIHRPPLQASHALDAAGGPGEENFTLVGATPLTHPLFNDGPGHFHDPQIAAEAVREAGEFVGHRYFGVPDDRPGLFYRFALDLTDLAAWRTAPDLSRPVPLATHITARPAGSALEVPRGLDLRLRVSVDGRPCATGVAGLVFLTSERYREHVEHSREARQVAPDTWNAPDGPDGPDGPGRPDGPPRPADSAETGRRTPENVVIGEPTEVSRGRIGTWLLPTRVSPVFTGEDGRFSGLHLLEALRQTSLLAAGRVHGLDAARSTLGGCRVHFRGPAERDQPVRCVAVTGRPGRDDEGRPTVAVTLTLTQRRRAVAEARTSVVQDH